MLEALNITAEQAAGLDELAALDLAMAKDLAAAAMAACDPQVKADLARSYQRMARSYRQTVALKVKLQKELRAAEDAKRPSEDVAERIAHRKALLRQKIRRAFYGDWQEALETETEPEERERLAEALEARLEAWAARPGFLHEPVEFLEERILADLEPVFEAVFARFYEDPEPPPPDAAPPPFESSA